jgi:hypothetical protein
MAGGGTPYKYFSGKGSGLVHELLAKLPGGWGEKVSQSVRQGAGQQTAASAGDGCGWWGLWGVDVRWIG